MAELQHAELYDVTIIGGGPVGLFSAFYSGMREMKTKIIESAAELGGKLQFYPDKILHDIGGIDAISGAQFKEQVIRQGMTFKPTIVLSERIDKCDRLQDGTIRLTSHTGVEHLTRTVILAIGHGTFVPRKLDQEGVEVYEERNLHYAVDSLEHFRNKKVLISGGGDSAVDWANALEPIAKKVIVVHRRDEFGGHESNVTQMRNSSVEILTPFLLKEVHGNGEVIDKVTIEQADNNETMEIAVDEVIVNHGIMADLGAIKHWGLEIIEDRIGVDCWMTTSIPGIFAAGDGANYPSKLKLIAGGFTEGPTAVNSAKRYITQEELQPIYSTHHDQLIAMHEEKEATAVIV